MIAYAKTFRRCVLAGTVGLLTAGGGDAVAKPASCVNDSDCIATPECGGDVCDSTVMECKPASIDSSDGRCTQDSNCKCAAVGAKCGETHCTFTTLSDAPAAIASRSAAVGSATYPGTGAAGSSGTAGSGTTTSYGSGGCSIVTSTPTSSAAMAGLGMLVALIIRRSRRRRS
jgi:MYXO-CTERM domain-containing protein